MFSVNLGNMGNFRPFGEIRGEQLLVYVDGVRVAQVDWDKAFGVGPRSTKRAAGSCKTIDVTLPMKAGLHHVGVTFLATNFAPGLDMNHAFERSTIETGGLPGFTFYPHIGSVRIDGPPKARWRQGFAEPRADLHLPAGTARERRRSLRAGDRDDARAPRISRLCDERSTSIR